MYYVPAFGSGFWSFNSVSLFLLSALNYCRPRREEHSPLNRELLLRGRITITKSWVLIFSGKIRALFFPFTDVYIL